MSDEPSHAKERELRVEISSLKALLVQAGLDADEQNAAARLQRVLIDELYHREKNMLAIVIAITSQTLRLATSLEEGRTALEKRLMAMSRAHDILRQKSWTGADLDTLVHGAIEAFQGTEKARFNIYGEQDVWLYPPAALAIALSINELCTNASKYGALSNPNGRTEISWTIKPGTGQLRLLWKEKGGPPVRPPSRRGFGSQLVEDVLAKQFGGSARLNYEPSGLVCEFDLPPSAINASGNMSE